MWGVFKPSSFWQKSAGWIFYAAAGCRFLVKTGVTPKAYERRNQWRIFKNANQTVYCLPVIYDQFVKPHHFALIFFKEPISNFSDTRTVAKQERRVIACPAVAGCVVLFESWQRHTVPPNAGEDERMSISFNYHWRYEKPTTGHLSNDGS